MFNRVYSQVQEHRMVYKLALLAKQLYLILDVRPFPDPSFYCKHEQAPDF